MNKSLNELHLVIFEIEDLLVAATGKQRASLEDIYHRLLDIKDLMENSNDLTQRERDNQISN